MRNVVLVAEMNQEVTVFFSSAPKRSLLALLCAVLLLAAACGSDDRSEIEVSADADPAQSPQGDSDGADPLPESADDPPEGPIPVEPDGGIGDGAEPLPGAEEPADEGTWHGAVVAETNCPGTTWQRVEAGAFSFSVPDDFVENEVQPIDSEIGLWTSGGGIEVMYDYGWYSGSIREMSGAEVEPIDYSGYQGTQSFLRATPGSGDKNMVEVFFGELVADDGDQWNRLSMLVTHDDPADEIIGRCIVVSIEWNL